MTQLGFVAAMVAGELMHENNWQPSAHFLIVKFHPILSGNVRHGPDLQTTRIGDAQLPAYRTLSSLRRSVARRYSCRTTRGKRWVVVRRGARRYNPNLPALVD